MLVTNVAIETSSDPDETRMLVILNALSSVVDWRALTWLGSTYTMSFCWR
jgi:hypothetical protein